MIGALQTFRPPIFPLIAALLVAGLAAWVFLAYRRSRRTGPAPILERIRDWTEAGCPACMLAGALLDRDALPAAEASLAQ